MDLLAVVHIPNCHCVLYYYIYFVFFVLFLFYFIEFFIKNKFVYSVWPDTQNVAHFKTQSKKTSRESADVDACK